MSAFEEEAWLLSSFTLLLFFSSPLFFFCFLTVSWLIVGFLSRRPSLWLLLTSTGQRMALMCRRLSSLFRRLPAFSLDSTGLLHCCGYFLVFFFFPVAFFFWCIFAIIFVICCFWALMWFDLLVEAFVAGSALLPLSSAVLDSTLTILFPLQSPFDGCFQVGFR